MGACLRAYWGESGRRTRRVRGVRGGFDQMLPPRDSVPGPRRSCLAAWRPFRPSFRVTCSSLVHIALRPSRPPEPSRAGSCGSGHPGARRAGTGALGRRRAAGCGAHPRARASRANCAIRHPLRRGRPGGGACALFSKWICFPRPGRCRRGAGCPSSIACTGALGHNIFPSFFCVLRGAGSEAVHATPERGWPAAWHLGPPPATSATAPRGRRPSRQPSPPSHCALGALNFLQKPFLVSPLLLLPSADPDTPRPPRPSPPPRFLQARTALRPSKLHRDTV